MSENNKLLANTVKNSWAKLRILILKGNKLYYAYSTGGLTA